MKTTSKIVKTHPLANENKLKGLLYMILVSVDTNVIHSKLGGLRKVFASIVIILTVCAGSLFAQPTITSFTPTGGPTGTSVAITGTNFDTTPANNTVFFGATQATVSAATATELTVTVPIGATYMPITVLVNDLTAYSSKPFVATFDGSAIKASSFDTKVGYALQQGGATSGVLSDLDGDGNADLIATNENTGKVSIFRNTSVSGTIDAGSFDTRVSFATGTGPYLVAVGDLDGDGKPDLAVVNFTSNTVSLFRNTCMSGTLDANSFATKVDFSTGSGPRSVVIGDLDGNGKPELVVVNQTSGTVSVFRNISTSGTIDANSFATRVDYTAGTDPTSAALADLDGDGKADMAVTNATTNTVSVYRNTSTSGVIDVNSFASSVDFTTGITPRIIAIGDLDGDGKPDMVVPNLSSSTISILRNTSTSGVIDANSFAAKMDLTGGSGAFMVSIGDLDGDSKVDLAVVNLGVNTVSIFRNTSTNGAIDANSFASRVDFPTASSSRSVVIGDVDGDNKPDLFVACSGSNTVFVLKNAIVPPSSETDITDFSFSEQTSAATIDATNHTVDIEVAYGSDVTALIATFSLSSGARAEVGASSQTSATTSNDFTSAVTYTVIAEDGSTAQDWTVTVTILPASTETKITAFSFVGVTASAVIDALNPVVDVEVPFGTDVTSLTPSISVSANATIFPNSGEAQNFTNAIIYEVTAEDGSTNEFWVVSVTEAPASTETSITDFSLAEETGAAVVDEANATVNIEVAYGTDITNLTPTITLSANATISPNSGVAKDFSSPVMYTVTAEDGSTTRDWTVAASVALNPAADFTVFSFPEQTGAATIDVMNQTVDIEVEFGTDISGLVATYALSSDASAGVDATAQVSGITVNDFTNAVTYTITAANGVTTKDWIVSVTVAPNTETDITVFSFSEQTGAATIDAANSTVDVEVAMGTNLTALVATFVLSPNASAKVGFINQVSIASDNDFTTPVTYTITAEDGVTMQDWIVTVTVVPASTETEITAFSLAEQVQAATIDAANFTVAIEVPFGTDLTGLIPTITVSTNATVSPLSGVAQDFSSPINYTVTAEDGTTTQDWIVTVAVTPPSTEIEITAFSFVGEPGTTTISTINNTVNVEVAFGTDVTGLIPSIGLSSSATVNPNDGVAQDFSSPVIYTVTAQDGSTNQDWTVTVTFGLNPATEITAFSFAEQTGVANIDAMNQTIDVEVDFGTDLTGLVATFTLSSGASVEVGATSQVSGTTANDFSSPVTYLVTAENTTTTQNWTVTVTTALNAAAEITAFSFPEQTGAATIDGANFTVDIEVDFGTDLSGLVATFALSTNANAEIGATAQVSGTTANDFNSFVTYSVIAEDGNIQDWVVTVTVGPNTAVTITAFSPMSGLIGTQVTISGNNFDTTPANNIVFFGATQAVVTVATTTELTVTVPTGATYLPISVLANELVAYSSTPFVVTFGGNMIDANSFASKINFLTGTRPWAVAIGDLDGDGKADLVVVNQGSNTVSVYRNMSTNGTIAVSSFADKVDLATGLSPLSVAIGDLDGDGKAELSVTNYDSNTISIFKNTSSSGVLDASSFATKVDFITGTRPYSVAIGDLNGDGKAELAVSNNGSTAISVFRNTTVSSTIDGNSFATKVDYTTGIFAKSLSIGDLDGDGKADLVVSQGSGNGLVAVFRNTIINGVINASSFATRVEFITGANPQYLALGDLDGDGKADLVTANYNDGTVSILRNTSTIGTMDVNSFATKVDFATGTNPQSVAIGDLDGDGKVDLAVASKGTNRVAVFRNSSTTGALDATSFSSKVDFITGFEPWAVAIGDLDGDGKAELTVTSSGEGQVSVFRNLIIPPSTETDITAFSLTEQVQAATIDDANFTIAIEVPFGTDVTALIPALTVSANATVSPLNGVVQDFSSPVNYTVTAEDGTTMRDWTVTVAFTPASTETDITTFSLAEQIQMTTFDAANFTIDIEVPFGTDVTVLVPTLTVSTNATVSPISGEAQDFSSPVSYTVTAEDGTTSRDWTVTVAVTPGSVETDITAFSISGKTIEVIMDAVNHTIAMEVFFNADVTNLTPTISLSAFATVSPLSGVAQDFSSPVDYTVTAEDGTTQTWIVTVTVGSPPPTLTSFTPTSGVAGTEVIISGTNFDTTPANNTVFFGATQAIVSAATATELTVSVPQGATYMPITVLVNGLITYSAAPFVMTFDGGNIKPSSFATNIDITASTPISVAIGDLDGDGKADLAVANYNSGTVSVYRNTSTSADNISYASNVDYSVGTAYAIAIGDLDGDGKLDLAIANEGSNTVSIMRNTSTIGVIDATSFADKVVFSTGTFTYGVAIGDLDGDGKPDLAVVNQFNHTVSVFRNTSINGVIDASSFAEKVDYTTGLYPTAVAIGDLDGDGKPDLAVTNWSDNSVSVFRNISTNGVIDASSFAGKVDYSTGSTPLFVAIGDLDGDGRVDLAVANYGNGSLSVLRNASTSGVIDATSFADKVDYATGSSPYSVAIGDINGDGKADLAVPNYNSSTVSVLKNTSTSGVIDATSFADKMDYIVGGKPSSVGIGDLDGDGRVDLAVTNYNSNTISVLRSLIVPPSTETDMTAFSFTEQTGAAAIDAANHAIAIEVPIATDPSGLVATYSLSADASAQVDVTTQVSGTTANDFTTPVTYTIVAEDGVTTQDWLVTVTIQNSNPTDILLSQNTIAENSVIGTVVGTFSSTDVDAGNTFIYSLVAGTGSTDNASFIIENGALKSAQTFDFDAQSSFSIRVKTDDGNGGAFEKEIIISVEEASDQTITFDVLADQVFGVAAFDLTATATSNLDVIFSLVSGPATLSGNTVTITGAGTVVIAADQAGDPTFNAAPQVEQSFTVAKANQAITIAAIADKSITDAAFDVSASVDTNLALTYAVTGVATISGTTISLDGTAGSVTVTVSQAGNENHNAASAEVTFEVIKLDQTITFAALVDQVFGVAAFDLSATASSNLDVAFSIVSGPATLSSNTLTITGSGTVVVAADQAGDATFSAAAQVTQSFDVAKADQVITITAIDDKVTTDAAFDVVASVDTGLDLTYAVTGVATISGTTITLDGVSGGVTVTVSQAGNGNYAAVSASITFNVIDVDKTNQTITFDALADKVFGDAAFDLSAIASSDLAVSFSIVSGPAILSGNTVTITGVGTVVVAAEQAGDGTFNAAPQVTQSFAVAKADQTITITAIDDKVTTDAAFDVVASVDSGLDLAYAVTGSATISGTTITLDGTSGTVTVTVNQVGNEDYNAASTSIIFNVIDVNKTNQTITFDALADKVFGDVNFDLSATASSDLAVTFSIVSGSAILSGNTVTITGVGTVVVAAEQAGDGTFNAAPQVEQSFTIAKANQVITIAAIADKSITDAAFDVSASVDTNLALTYAVTGVATISGTTITLDGTAGSVTLTVSQAGDENHNAASAEVTFEVLKLGQTITFTSLTDKVFGDAAFDLSATASSNLDMAFSIVSGPATLSGNTVTITGVGTVVVAADQAGDATFNAAPQVTQSFDVAKADQTIAFTALADKVFGDAAFDLSGTASSNLDVTFSIVSGPATLSGNTVTITGAGIVVVASDQEGDATFNAAPQVTQSFAVAKADQTISITAIEDKLTTDADFDITASVDSGLDLTYAVTGVATISGTNITLDGTSGTVSVTVSQAGNDNYNTATATVTFNVADPEKTDQNISFDALVDKVFGDADFDLAASSDSNLEVSFSIVSGPATLTGNTVKIIGAGTVVIAADQSGDATFNAAPQVTQSFVVAKANQTISITAIDDKSTTDAAFDVVASVDSGMDLTYAVTGVATISGTTITLDGTSGTVTVTVSQAGSDNYNSATESVSFEVVLVTAVEPLAFSIEVYPNPAKDWIMIKGDDLQEAQIQLFNTNGRVLKDQLLNPQGRINLEGIEAGIYIIRLSTSKMTTTTKILIK